MQIVAPARFLDGVVFAVFLLFVSGAGLFIFGEFHKTAMCVITEAKKLGMFADIMDKAPLLRCALGLPCSVFLTLSRFEILRAPIYGLVKVLT
ncbi:unnamed protein product [Symbiodinium sp. CCMP2592]|nr:unnamed protein product [Symbiodinium sp. CCMP2592]